MNGQGLWIINNAMRYSSSQILLITPAKLKEDGEITGVRMKVETYKSRFAQMGKKTEVEVPWMSGMSKYSGFLDMMEEQGIVNAAGAWKSLDLPGQKPIKFQSKDLDEELVNKILSHPKIVESEKTVLALMATDTGEDSEAEKE